ncbi:unnamed protein product [Lactuca virosa]|uniref:Uncharacterized protein n=1 Tax=Lactuca virosa TaxID=75947 RepID=A0AAU9MP91_9ASTR|nr:unnamed protein product [Lactuca virosa]
MQVPLSVDKTIELEPTAICDNNLTKTNESSRHVISSVGKNAGLETTPVTTKNETKEKVISVDKIVSSECTPTKKKKYKQDTQISFSTK